MILKFLARIEIETETVQDGVQATETIFSKPPGYYSIVLVSSNTDLFCCMLTLISVIYTCPTKMGTRLAKRSGDGRRNMATVATQSSHSQPTSWVMYTQSV